MDTMTENHVSLLAAVAVVLTIWTLSGISFLRRTLEEASVFALDDEITKRTVRLNWLFIQ